ncbi:MAG: hypothetical protein FJ137_06320 [Deltaproteobacteria bacterium]|nr:hypothetical protein [Deltaproteobacteria bacterium]
MTATIGNSGTGLSVRTTAARSSRATASPAVNKAALRGLVEPSSVRTPEELLSRLKRLEASLVGDGRVVFPAVYAAITKASVRLVADRGVDDVERSRALIVDFGRRYLQAFADHLDGAPVASHWQRHFALAAGPKPSLRAAASAINAHLSVDLAEAVFATGAGRAYAPDFATFGRSLAATTPDLVAALARHGVAAERFVKGWFLGDVLDGVAGAGTTSRLGFQVVRAEAFANAMLLRECAVSPALVRAGMRAACRNRETTLDVLVRS